MFHLSPLAYSLHTSYHWHWYKFHMNDPHVKVSRCTCNKEVRFTQQQRYESWCKCAPLQTTLNYLTSLLSHVSLHYMALLWGGACLRQQVSLYGAVTCPAWLPSSYGRHGHPCSSFVFYLIMICPIAVLFAYYFMVCLVVDPCRASYIIYFHVIFLSSAALMLFVKLSWILTFFTYIVDIFLASHLFFRSVS